MKPQICRNDSHIGFLDPPHTHDPSSVSNIATLPSPLLLDLPNSVQATLANLQESTSIAFASLIRLRELLEERLDRLMPSPDDDGSMTFSESSFFNFSNALNAEHSYLLYDALPDWRHKASLARAALHAYMDLPLSCENDCVAAVKTVLEWWECLQTTVLSWSDEVQIITIPDYEETIEEYFLKQRRDQSCSLEPDDSPIDTPDETPTPTLGSELKNLQLADVKMRDFAASIMPQETDAINVKVTGFNLPKGVVATRLASAASEEFLLQDEGVPRDERKDSGISMAS